MRYIFRNTDSHDKIVKYDITYVGYDDLTQKRYVKLINSDTNKIHSLYRDELHSYYKGLHKFYKCDRSTFSYWFAHWCAFQLTALNLRRWKFKYLFHDFEKPWMKLFMKYKSVQKWHREHNKHHLEYGLKHGWDNIDWEALIIDWECSRLTKAEAELDAFDTMVYELENNWKDYKDEISKRFYNKLYEMEL